MKQNKYQAPAIIDKLTMELEAEILGSSGDVNVDQNIRQVETMGQEVGGTVGAEQWLEGWK
ncbi:MAG: hypothetical protein J5478_00525 [Bacteroidales bacterium]|nr:hypothetical protein [Bacteroidales bacterium]